jgi:WD40 repeat protein
MLWDAATGQAEKTFTGHMGTITSVAFSPDGKKILTGSGDKTANLWNVGTGQAEKTFKGHAASVSAVAFSPDGKKVLTGSVDRTAKLWDVQSDAIEDKVARHSFYELLEEGVQFEEEDMGQYRLDSLAFFEKNKQDFIHYHFLMDSLAQVKGLTWDRVRNQFRAKSEGIETSEWASVEEKDFITNLQNQIAIESDTIKLNALYGQLIDSLRNQMQVSPNIYSNTLADAYNNHAWYSFFLQAFNTAEQDIRAGIAVDSTYKYLYTNLAPALLLQGQYKAAEAEYLKWKYQPFGEPAMATYREAFLQDLEVFEKAGIIPAARKQDVEKIRGLLKE